MVENFLSQVFFVLILIWTAVPRVSATTCGTQNAPTCTQEVTACSNRVVQDEAVLRGLRWVDEFIQRDENLYFIFSDCLLMLNELASRRPGPVADTARHMLMECFQRGADNLSAIFEPNVSGKWDFISILSLVKTWHIPEQPFLEFYRENFPPTMRLDYHEEFKKALSRVNYDMLGDILIDTSFAWFFNREFPNAEFDVPETGFAEYLKQITRLPYLYNFKRDPAAYSEQNYYVTHVVFVATNYGQKPMPEGKLARELKGYLLNEFPSVRHDDAEVDLIAEFIHCFKIFGMGDVPEVREAVRYLLSQQHPDGSWGTEEDFEGDAYDIFHPTWAVITALNY